MTTYIVTGSDTGIPRLPNDSVIAGLKKGDTFSTTLDSGVETELIGAGLIAKSPLSSPVIMLSDGSLEARDGRSFSGGSGAPAGAHITHKFPFTFDTGGSSAALAAGVPAVFTDGYTPAIGDLLISAFIAVDTAWNGTTPFGDFGAFDTQYGWLGNTNATKDMTLVDAASDWGAPLLQEADMAHGSPGDMASAWLVVTPLASQRRGLPARFAAPDPIKVCVSQTGQNDGADPGSTQGAASLYVTTATPHA